MFGGSIQRSKRLVPMNFAKLPPNAVKGSDYLLDYLIITCSFFSEIWASI